jgi:NAD(P)-dependent dehydrogenase (short-subunit alcohol dehydrogenase family)
MASGILSRVPMKRFGSADEVVNGVLFLASSESAYIAGSEINVDGGMAQV